MAAMAAAMDTIAPVLPVCWRRWGRDWRTCRLVELTIAGVVRY